ncbi:hypothetical protein C497_16702 [Halalkalicoccus jeotgali B3]|uniref:Uncharacterized protein n=1 Tax=Halalkalicoccus jeotgali (strain DSM 18796 / CECT 7217 / JCM 14584 / KCTC 4019 / B3) TaxID=795797 RepID=D8J6P0_HALJB|nr:hypothetical protein [Halalkalicoccus jeotgali]ADJ13917.1 hypothetical protein HacjB3_02620 [Halalkalicoccus jeotgali B3]ELY34038.1 hypothetical protein C497_16702 [Halalkalicoccus jeotgali B3]
MIGRDVDLIVTIGVIEVAECAAALLDDLDTEGAVVLDMPRRPGIALPTARNYLFVSFFMASLLAVRRKPTQ